MEIETDIALETKAGIPADAAVTHAELMRAFDEFKEANDERLSEKRSVDVLLEEKIERLDSVIAAQTQRLEAVELKQARPAIGSEPRLAEPANQPSIEHKAAFDAYVREGILQICAHSNRKHCRVAQIPMAASWCRRKSNTSSASGCSTFRRCVRSSASAPSAAMSTRSR
jgi:hypothetical protein